MSNQLTKRESSRRLTMAEKEEMYDKLYAIGVRLLKKYNPCEIKDGDCIKKSGFCCAGCRHLGKNGCKVKCLYCKLWLCWKLSSDPSNRKIRRILWGLSTFAGRYGLLHMRHSKKYALTHSARHIQKKYKTNY